MMLPGKSSPLPDERLFPEHLNPIYEGFGNLEKPTPLLHSTQI